MAIGNWGYQNGAIPAEAMVSAGGVLLKPSTAAQCTAWLAAANAQGVALAFNEGYRDLATQEYWRTVWTNRGLPNNAAVPGTSTHGYGQAVDINRDAYNADEYQAIIDTGAEFGMILNSNESWHFADAGTVTGDLTPGNVTTADAALPIPIELKVDPLMARYIRNSDTGTIAIANIDTGLWWELNDPAYVPLLDARKAWDRTLDLNIPANEYNFFKAMAESVRRP